MDSTAKRVARNTLWLFSQAVAGRLIAFILIIYLARMLGDLDFGKFSFAAAFVQILIFLADLGVSFLILKDVARDRENAGKYFSNVFFIKIILSILTCGIMAALASILNFPADTKMIIYLLGLCSLLESMGNLCGSIFQACERMKYMFLTEIIEKVFRVLVCIIFLSMGYGLITVAFLYFLSGGLYLVLNFILLIRHMGKLNFAPDIGFCLDLFRRSLPFALSGLLLMFYYYIGTVMLGKMKGEQFVGWYSASFQLYLALGIMASVFLSAVFPVMARKFQTSADSLRKVYTKCFKYLLALGVPMAVGGVILGEKIIYLFYGNAYHNSVLPFRLIVAITAFSYINSLGGYFLTSVERINDRNKIFAISTLTNAALNLVLIPDYGCVGSAIAIMVSEVLFCVFCMIYIGRYCCHHVPWNLILKTLPASVMMGIFLFLFPDINLALLISGGITIYFIFLWLFGYFNKEDKLLFREVIRLYD